MKKKVLIVLLVLLLALSLVATVVACKPKTPNNKPGEGQKPGGDEPVAEAQMASAGDCVTSIFNSASDTMNCVAEISDSLSAKATVYANIGGKEIALTVAGNFDEKVAKNNDGLITVSIDGKDILTLYAENEIVYVGDALTNAEVQWTKLTQVESADFIKTYFAKVPGLLEGKIKKNMLTEYASYAALAGPVAFKVNAAPSYNLQDDEDPDVNGDYDLTLDLTKVTALLPKLGLNLDEILEGDAIASFKPIIDTAVELLLGCTVSDLTKGTIDATKTPAIGLKATIANDKLSAASFSYKKSSDLLENGIDIVIGVKDLSIGKSYASYKPANLTTANAKDAALKLTATLSVPEVNKKPITIIGYAKPTFSISWVDRKDKNGDVQKDEDGKAIKALRLNIADIFGVAYAEVDSKQIPLAVDFNRAAVRRDDNFPEYQIRFDLEGLYQYLGIDYEAYGIGTQYTYTFNTQNIIDSATGAVVPVAAPLNEKSDLQTVVDSFKGGFTFDSVIQNIGSYLNLLKTVIGKLDDFLVVDKVNLTATVDASKLLKVAYEIVKTAEFPDIVKDNTEAINIVDFLQAETLIPTIAKCFGVEDDVVRGYIDNFLPSHNNSTIEEYLLGDNGAKVIADVDYNTNSGAGFALTIKAGDDVIGAVSLKAEIITTDEVKDDKYGGNGDSAYMTSNFSGKDLSAEDESDKLVGFLLKVVIPTFVGDEGMKAEEFKTKYTDATPAA